MGLRSCPGGAAGAGDGASAEPSAEPCGQTVPNELSAEENEFRTSGQELPLFSVCTAPGTMRWFFSPVGTWCYCQFINRVLRSSAGTINDSSENKSHDNLKNHKALGKRTELTALGKREIWNTKLEKETWKAAKIREPGEMADSKRGTSA